MPRRKAKGRREEPTDPDMDADSKSAPKKGQPAQSKPTGNPASSGLPLVGPITFASDPSTVAIYDDESLEEFSIFTPYGGTAGQRQINWNSAQGLNRPIVFDKVINDNVLYNPRQLTIVNETLIEEAIVNGLNRIMTTPGDISMANIQVACRQYIAMLNDLICIYASAAALWGLSEVYPTAKGQIRDYLYLIGARPNQLEAMASSLRDVPMPSNLYTFLMSWNAVKQIPDGRKIFAVPQQPIGLTPDEIVGGPAGIQSGNQKNIFDALMQDLKGLQDATGAVVYPELRRIFMNAGWNTYEFPTSIAPTANAEWWDGMVLNAPYGAKKFSDSVGLQQLNPQAGRGNRSRSLSVYAQDNNPYLNRCLFPIYGAGTTNMYDRGTGAFDLNASATGLDCGIVSMGMYNVTGGYDPNTAGWNPGYPTASGGIMFTMQACPLIIGQSADTQETGWANTIAGFAASVDVSCLYSEMMDVIQLDASATAANPIGIYELIFQGASTTPASNRFKFGNTVTPDMYTIDQVNFLQGPFAPTMNTNDGNPGALIRIYTALLSGTQS